MLAKSVLDTSVIDAVAADIVLTDGRTPGHSVRKNNATVLPCARYWINKLGFRSRSRA